MSKQQIKQLIANQSHGNGMVETGVKGVRLFQMTESIRCAPAVYEPCVVAIVNGSKEAILDGKRTVYDSRRYMCCPLSMPVEAGAPAASPDSPLMGVYISLDTRVMTTLAMELESAVGLGKDAKSGAPSHGLAFSRWDDGFTESLWRLLQLLNCPEDMAILGDGRLREVYYAVLKGEAGKSARRAFSVGNEISKAIEFLSSRLAETVTIDELAAHVGMSRAAFHRKFKQATAMSPLQFAKSMRLNNAAMKIAGGMTAAEAASKVGYTSSSQFNREFKRMYGESPKRWSHSRPYTMGMT